MSFVDEPKNPRLSVHNKYKRRLRSLVLGLDDFIQHADMKLDESVAGKIYKRQEIEEIVSKARELAELLPSPEEALDCPSVRDDFLEILQSAAENTDKILEEANNFFESLSKDEWDEMAESYKRKT